MTSQSEQLEEVEAWLRDDVFRYAAPPSSWHTQLPLLQKLMTAHEAAERAGSARLRQAQARASEYAAERDALRHILQGVGTSPRELSLAGARALRALAAVVLLLQAPSHAPADAPVLLVALDRLLEREQRMILIHAKKFKSQGSSKRRFLQVQTPNGMHGGATARSLLLRVQWQRRDCSRCAG